MNFSEFKNLSKSDGEAAQRFRELMEGFKAHSKSQKQNKRSNVSLVNNNNRVSSMNFSVI